MNILQYTLSCLLFGVFIFSQTAHSINGKVTDFHDLSPIENANVQLNSYTTKTNAMGEFSLQNIPTGEYTLLVSHEGCQNFEKKIRIDHALFIPIKLEHHTEEIETVALHAVHTSKNQIGISTLDQDFLEKNTTENLGNLLSNISGVSTLKTGNAIAKPVIHGMYGSRVSIYNNGVKMAEQEWGVEHSPNVDVASFEHIDVVKGASALQYGTDAVGGVVVLLPKSIPPRDTLMGDLRFSGISNGKGTSMSAQFLSSFKNHWFVKAGGSYKKLGDLQIPNHTLQNTGSENNSYNFSFGQQRFLKGFEVAYSGVSQVFGIYKGAHLGSPEDFYNAITFGQPYYLDQFSYSIDHPKQEVAHHLMKVSAFQRYENWGKFSFQYSFQYNLRKEYDIRKGDLKDIPSLNLRLITHSASVTHLLERKDWSLESTLSGNLQDNFPDPATKARRLIPDYYKYEAGVFSIFKYKMNQKWKLEFASRLDFTRYDAYKYYDKSTWENNFSELFPSFLVQINDARVLTRPILDFFQFSTNVGLSYQKNNHFLAQINFSRVDRAPNPAELFADGLHHSAAIIEEGNLASKKETVYQTQLNMRGQISVLDGMKWSLSPYFSVSSSYINQVPTGLITTNRGVFPVWSYQQIKAKIYGIDADLNLKISKNLEWSSSFSTLRGTDDTHQEALILMMPTQFRNAIEWTLIPQSKMVIRLENQSVLRQKRYPVRDVAISFISNGQINNTILDYSTPPASYSVFNASIGLRIFKNTEILFRVNNIFNTEYREYLNRLRYFMPEAGRNFIFTLQYQF